MNQQFFDRERAGVAGGALWGVGGSAGGSLRPEAEAELLTRFALGKKAVYFYCERTSARDNLARFRDLLADALGVEFLKEASFSDWEPLFQL